MDNRAIYKEALIKFFKGQHDSDALKIITTLENDSRTTLFSVEENTDNNFLHLALINNCPQSAEKLFQIFQEKRAEALFMKNNAGESILQLALKNGNDGFALAWMIHTNSHYPTHPYWLQMEESSGNSLLHLALIHDCPESACKLFEILTERDEPILLQPNKASYSILLLAILSKNDEMAVAWINHTRKINNPEIVLHQAIINGCIKSINRILKSLIEVEHNKPYLFLKYNGQSILHLLLLHNHKDLALKWMRCADEQNQSDPTHQYWLYSDKQNTTPLTIAIVMQLEEPTQHLLSKFTVNQSAAEKLHKILLEQTTRQDIFLFAENVAFIAMLVNDTELNPVFKYNPSIVENLYRLDINEQAWVQEILIETFKSRLLDNLSEWKKIQKQELAAQQEQIKIQKEKTALLEKFQGQDLATLSAIQKKIGTEIEALEEYRHPSYITRGLVAAWVLFEIGLVSVNIWANIKGSHFKNLADAIFPYDYVATNEWNNFENWNDWQNLTSEQQNQWATYHNTVLNYSLSGNLTTIPLFFLTGVLPLVGICKTNPPSFKNKLLMPSLWIKSLDFLQTNLIDKLLLIPSNQQVQISKNVLPELQELKKGLNRIQKNNTALDGFKRIDKLLNEMAGEIKQNKIPVSLLFPPKQEVQIAINQESNELDDGADAKQPLIPKDPSPSPQRWCSIV